MYIIQGSVKRHHFISKGLFCLQNSGLQRALCWLCISLFALTYPSVAFTQQCKTDAKAIYTSQEFVAAVKVNPKKKLLELKKVIPGIIIDMPYATVHNFTHTILYRNPVAYLHDAPANALKEIQEDLRKKGLALKIYDAFRPFSVTCVMWRLVPDRHYTANPRKGSNHNRGLAVDVTIINLKTGKELDMGTAYDCFNDSAHHAFTNLPEHVLANRRLLKYEMWKHGFGLVPTEWWHYQWHNDQDYEVIDLEFDDIKELL
jgi:D-alanyl-D-alanine dipeptidase